MLEAKAPEICLALDGLLGKPEERAMLLLLRHLSPEQRESLLAKGSFVVKGGGLFARYRLTAYKRRKGNWLPLWPLPFPSPGCCVYAGAPPAMRFSPAYGRERAFVDPVPLPEGDQLLALKLLIETDEKEFRRHADWTLT